MNEPNYRTRQLGRTLRRLREAAGMSQEELGRPLRFSKSKMSRIEQGYIPGTTTSWHCWTGVA
jgi:transcriptional regulator with XRE-family HTH domain